MIDYRCMEPADKLLVELGLATEGVHGKYFDQIEKGELCAKCRYPEYNCRCVKPEELEERMDGNEKVI